VPYPDPDPGTGTCTGTGGNRESDTGQAIPQHSRCDKDAEAEAAAAPRVTEQEAEWSMGGGDGLQQELHPGGGTATEDFPRQRKANATPAAAASEDRPYRQLDPPCHQPAPSFGYGCGIGDGFPPSAAGYLDQFGRIAVRDFHFTVPG